VSAASQNAVIGALSKGDRRQKSWIADHQKVDLAVLVNNVLRLFACGVAFSDVAEKGFRDTNEDARTIGGCVRGTARHTAVTFGTEMARYGCTQILRAFQSLAGGIA
jgi:hypothetical protein